MELHKKKVKKTSEELEAHPICDNISNHSNIDSLLANRAGRLGKVAVSVDRLRNSWNKVTVSIKQPRRGRRRGNRVETKKRTKRNECIKKQR